MKKLLKKRLLAMLLVFAMLVSAAPVAFAEDGADLTENDEFEPVEEFLEEKQIPEGESEDAIMPDEPDDTSVEGPEIETLPDEPTSDELLEEEIEEESTLLPFGFKGMGEGFVLSERDVKLKTLLAENGLPGVLESKVPGVDYVEGQLMFLADSEEYAMQVAEAYNAELVSLNYGVAVISLLENTVFEAMAVASDISLPMPPVDPNYISVNYAVTAGGDTFGESLMAPDAPERQTWLSWYENAGASADTYLRDPDTVDYQWHHEAIDTYAAWGVTKGASYICVGIISNGIYLPHSDFSSVTQIDVGCGTDVYYVPGIESDADYSGGRGTRVAGVVAASLENGIGGAGIAPGVTLVDLNAAGTGNYGSVKSANAVAALNYAADNGINIVYMDRLSDTYNSSLSEAVEKAYEKFVTIIAPIGDLASNEMEYPAACDHVIAVGATDRTGQFFNMSSYGSWCDVCAPGVDIWTNNAGGGYCRSTGTDMSAAVVTGLAALYASKHGGSPGPDAVEKALKSCCTKLSHTGSGAGLVNAAALFGRSCGAPDVIFLGENNEYLGADMKSLPYGGKLAFNFGDNFFEDGRIIIYTVDGSNPAVSNGKVVNGSVILADAIYLGDPDGCQKVFPKNIGKVGDKITIKAATVNGMGMMSPIRSLKVELTPDVENISELVLNSLDYVRPGSTVTLSAFIRPAEAEQRISWSLIGETNGASISSTGVLKVPASAAGKMIRVEARSVADPSYYKTKYIAVEARPKVTGIDVFPSVTLRIVPEKGVYETMDLHPTFTLEDGSTGVQLLYNDPIDGMQAAFTSSNTKVAVVDPQKGVITAVRPGSSTVTVKALDGSGKSAAVKVTVVSVPSSLSITGQDVIAPGTSAVYKAEILGKVTPKYKEVVWQIVNAPEGVTLDLLTGKVTVPAGTAPCSFKLIARPRYSQDLYVDGAPLFDAKVIYVSPKATYVGTDFAEGEYPAIYDYTYFSKQPYSTIKNCTLYKTDDPDTSSTIVYSYSDGNLSSAVWTSSKPGVASVEAYGLGGCRIRAVSSGTAKITLSMNDGSGKKTTFNVKVITPASSVTVRSDTVFRDIYGQESRNLAFGKSIQFKAKLGTAFGKPSVSKVNWDFQVVYKAKNKEDTTKTYLEEFSFPGYYKYDGAFYYYDITSYAMQKKFVTISSSGKLSVNRNFENFWSVTLGELSVYVSASSIDGHYVLGTSEEIRLQPATGYINIFDADGYPLKILNMAPRGREVRTVDLGAFYDKDEHCLQVSSSNPAVVGGDVSFSAEHLLLCLVAGENTGSAKVTLKATDGSGKTFSFTVKVS